ISTNGVYTAPNTRFSSLTIRATSVADNTRFGEARVTVNDPNDIQSVLARAVSVQRGISVNQSAVARPVAVQFGIASLSAAIARPVSVQRGNAATSAAIARPVSVQFSNFVGWTFPDAVSVTAGPYIQSISPGSFNRNTSTSVTINGVGLTGATALRFITASG